MAGRYMAGDPSLASLGKAFDVIHQNRVSFTFKLEVLQTLLEHIQAMVVSLKARVVDYSQLKSDSVACAASHFVLSVSADDLKRIRRRVQNHSKAPDIPFQPDEQLKHSLLSDFELRETHRCLRFLYSILAGRRGFWLAFTKLSSQYEGGIHDCGAND